MAIKKKKSEEAPVVSGEASVGEAIPNETVQDFSSLLADPSVVETLNENTSEDEPGDNDRSEYVIQNQDIIILNKSEINMPILREGFAAMEETYRRSNHVPTRVRLKEVMNAMSALLNKLQEQLDGVQRS